MGYRQWFKILSRKFSTSVPSFSHLPSPPHPFLVSVHTFYTWSRSLIDLLLFFTDPFFLFVQAGRRSTFEPFFLHSLFSIATLFNMVTPRFATVAVVALLGVANVSGLPVWPQQQIVGIYYVVFGWLAWLMALSARLISVCVPAVRGSGAISADSGLCETSRSRC
jgi:hypothetical protein